MFGKDQQMIGKMPESWGGGKVKNITFCVTEDCNLRCKYCYMTGKNTTKKMSIETGKKAVDFMLSNPDYNDVNGVVWDFIGGEPFLEIDLIDKLSDYIKFQMYTLKHPWFDKYRFSFSSNGLLYGDPKVQKYIKKNLNHLSIGISVDGNKIKHDLQRVKPDGSGSYDDIAKIVPLWQEQFPGMSTKATFASDDLPYLKDSIISMWEIGISTVMANVVFEDVWKEGDDEIFEKQLRDLADYVIENELWDRYSVRFFDPSIGFPLSDEDKKRNYCGSGSMIAVDCDGNLFPCIRFYDMSLNNKESLKFGSIFEGLNHDKIRAFDALSLETQSTAECIHCEVATGCAWCTGNNYDCAETDTIFQRTIFNCKMHKANVRANEYFWDLYEKKTGKPSDRRKFIQDRDGHESFLYFITSDDAPSFCAYTQKETGNIMSNEIIEKGLTFATIQGLTPVFLVGKEVVDFDLNCHPIISMPQAQFTEQNFYPVVTCVKDLSVESNLCILKINKASIANVYENVKGLLEKCARVTLSLEDIPKWSLEEISLYEQELSKLIELLLMYRKNGFVKEVNVLTDLLELEEMNNCSAGEYSFALAPNGKLYICPGFYHHHKENAIGDLETGIHLKNAHLLTKKHASLCSSCDANHCTRCKLLNIETTGQINVPSKNQCLISHKERNLAKIFQRRLKEDGFAFGCNEIVDISYEEPMDILHERKKAVCMP